MNELIIDVLNSSRAELNDHGLGANETNSGTTHDLPR